jgi:hypothetical protein
MTDIITPNSPATANDTSAVPTMDSIAAKMTAMKDMTLRNQIRATNETATGEQAESPVAPEGELTPPEVAEPEVLTFDDSPEEVQAPEEEYSEQVSEEPATESTQDELIDFIDFAETNPNAKFKFTRNGKEVVIDAKKAASILGQGGAIHEEARQLKIQKAEFDEYLQEQKQHQEGLTLAMEFTIEPKLQRAYDEIVKTQGYQTTFQQQLAQTQDPTQQARIRASMQQNERYIAEQGQLISQLKPNVDEFKRIRGEQVQTVLANNRKQFTDKELKKEYIYNEVRDKVAKTWKDAQGEIIPGIKNIDLISSDETLLGLIRDGLKFRDRPQAKQAGASAAVLTGRKTAIPNTKSNESDINSLREKAKGGDKKAADNLLMAQLAKLRATRGGR